MTKRKMSYWMLAGALLTVSCGALLCGNANSSDNVQDLESKSLSAATKQLEGNGTASNPYLIYDETDLNDIRNYAQYDNAMRSTVIRQYFQLKSSIVLSDEWIPIPYALYGSLDGNGYTISDMSIGINGEGSYGLFAMNFGTIMDLTFNNVSVNLSAGNDNVIAFGAAVGTNNGMVSNCDLIHTNIDLSNRYNSLVGGVVGSSYNGEITYCTIYDSCSIRGSGNIGGVVGYADFTDIENCTNRAEIKYYYRQVDGSAAGIVGKAAYVTTIQSCANYAQIKHDGSSNIFDKGDAYMGRIVGYFGRTCSYVANSAEGSVVGKGSNWNDTGIGFQEQ